jgi:hypothetical protein
MLMELLKSAVLALFVAPLTAEANEEAIAVNNQLSQCSEINNSKLITKGVVPTFSFELVLKDTIADCGCKSALGAFSVYARRYSYESFLIGGKVSLEKEGKKIIPVAADKNLIKSARLSVSVSCVQPY